VDKRADQEMKFAIDLYEGANGRIVRFDIHSAAGILLICNLFDSLAEKMPTRVELGSLVGVDLLSGVESVVLELAKNDDEGAKTVYVTAKDSGAFTVVWKRSTEGWRESAEMVKALRRSSHQYLGHQSIDDAVVEIAYRE